MRFSLPRCLLVVSAGVLAASCADPARIVAAPNASPAFVSEVATEYTTGTALTTRDVISALYDGDAEKALQSLYDEFLRAPTDDAKARCGPASSIMNRIADDLANGRLLSTSVAAADLAGVFGELSKACPSQELPITTLVGAARETVVSSADELLTLKFPAGTFSADAFLIVQRVLAYEAPQPPVLATSLRQFGPFYRVSTYPAVTRTGAFDVEAYLVGPLKVPADVANWTGLGSTSGGTTTVIEPAYCNLLAGRVGTWGGAAFLRSYSKASGADLGLGSFGVAFLSDSAGTSGSGCGQVPPPSDDGAFGIVAADVAGSVGVMSIGNPTTLHATLGVLQLYDPARSALARASLTAVSGCLRQVTVTNGSATDDFVAVIDPVNRKVGRWSGWKLARMVPKNSSVVVKLPSDVDLSAGEVQLSYGPESLAHVALQSALCPP